jgi:TonB family protein
MKHFIIISSAAVLFAGSTGLAQPQTEQENTYKVGPQGASAPKCTTTEPKYSEEALKNHIEGTVVLDAIVHADGSITVSKVAKSLGYGLDEAAQKSLMEWKCTPGQVKGESVSVQVQVQINFHLARTPAAQK